MATAEGYLLASRQVNPWLTGLSAVASCNSGFKFIGKIGLTYLIGLSSIWLMVGWVSGDYLAWRWIHARLRDRSEQVGAKTIPALLGASNQGPQRATVAVAALVTLVFLGTYAAAQLTAGSKTLHVLFGWNYTTGIVLGAAIVVAYCFAGGIRASIWTDAAQACVMLAAMFLLAGLTLSEVGGFRGLWQQLRASDPALVRWTPPDLRFGLAAHILAYVAAGLGVLGQPHIMIRAMAIDSSKNIGRARRTYIVWYICFYATTIPVGLCCRVLIPSQTDFDAELALPRISQMLLPELLIGFILAGLFAATISTADSQILSCSAALTQDLFPHWGNSYLMTIAGTIMVTVGIVLIVYVATDSVFNWSSYPGRHWRARWDRCWRYRHWVAQSAIDSVFP